MHEVSILGSSVKDWPYKLVKFSGGELQPRFTPQPDGHGSAIQIRADLFSSDDIMELILVVDAIRRATYAEIPIILICPYLPYARQDRVCAQGESLALKVMCEIINSLKFDTVEVWDVHSDVALALLDRVVLVHQKDLVPMRSVVRDWSDTILVAPDAGAIKKTLEIAKEYNMPMVRADKIRSVENGLITGTVVYTDHVLDKNFLMVDDICDGGRTFIELAKVLRGYTNGKVWLYVTHGIFSKDLGELLHYIDHIYVANPFTEYKHAVSTGYTVLKRA